MGMNLKLCMLTFIGEESHGIHPVHGLEHVGGKVMGGDRRPAAEIAHPDGPGSVPDL